MKTRRFYPSQVLLRLHARHVDSLSPGEQCALDILMKRSRRYRLQPTIGEDRIVHVVDLRRMKGNLWANTNLGFEPVNWTKAAKKMRRTLTGLSTHIGELGDSPEHVDAAATQL